MANRDAPLGFRVVGHLAGGMPQRFKRYHIASGLASNIARGDAVVPTATSKNIDFPATDTARVLGVFDGVFYLPADQGAQPVYAPRWASGTVPLANSSIDANVYDDPFLIFEVQYDGTFALADVGSLGDLVRTASDVATGQSRMEVDSAGSGTNTKILDIVNRPDNEYGAAAKILVTFAITYLAGAKTAI